MWYSIFCTKVLVVVFVRVEKWITLVHLLKADKNNLLFIYWRAFIQRRLLTHRVQVVHKGLTLIASQAQALVLDSFETLILLLPHYVKLSNSLPSLHFLFVKKNILDLPGRVIMSNQCCACKSMQNFRQFACHMANKTSLFYHHRFELKSEHLISLPKFSCYAIRLVLF